MTVITTTRRVTFAPTIQTMMEDTDLQVTDLDSPLADENTIAMDAESGPTKPREISEMTISPPPGFPQFQWPQADWILEGEPSIDPGLKFVTSWSTRIVKERAAGTALLTDLSNYSGGLSGLHDGTGGISRCCNTQTGGTGPSKINVSGEAQTTD